MPSNTSFYSSSGVTNSQTDATGTADNNNPSKTSFYSESGLSSTHINEIDTAVLNAQNSATAASASKDAALAALDNFDDRYLGVKSSNPTVDNDGNALVAGSLHYNSTDDTMKVYEGSAWVAAYASLSGAMLQTGGTMTGDLSFGDNVKANFGAGSDLQIYHSSTNSHIKDSGTGSLILQGDSLYLMNAAGSKSYFYGNASNGAAQLRYENSAKLTTTTTGVDVTGTASVTNLSETVFTVTGTTPALDPANGGIQTWTLSGASTPTDGFDAGESMTLMIDDGSANGITWPSMKWVGGTAPTLATTDYSVVVLWKIGSTLYGASIGNVA